MKKILFSIAGIGFGHASRCFAIIQKLVKEEKKFKIYVLSSLNSYKFFKKYRLPKNVKVIKIESIEMPIREKLDSFDVFFSNILQFPKLIRDYYKIKRIVEKVKPSLIINDSEVLMSYYLSKNNIENVHITNFPFTLSEYRYMKKERWMKEQINAIKRYLNGIKEISSVIISPCFFEKKSRKVIFVYPLIRESRKKIKTKAIIATFGGSEYGKIVLKQLLKNLEGRKLNEKFIITGIEIRKKNIIGKKFIENLQDYIKSSKGVITLSGLSTLGEIFYYKKPSLLFPIKYHIEQYANANYFRRKKLSIVCYELKKGKECLEKFLNEMNTLKKNIEKEKSQNGVKKIVEIIKEFLK